MRVLLLLLGLVRNSNGNGGSSRARAAPTPTILYVDATNGNDNNTGTDAGAPLLTCMGALKRVAGLSTVVAATRANNEGEPTATANAERRLQLPPGGVEVRISAGTYRYTAASACCMATSCGGTPIAGTEQSPLVIRGMPGPGGHSAGAGVVFDGGLKLNASLLRPVTNATVRAILNPAARDKVLAMPLALPPHVHPSIFQWNGIPTMPSRWPNTGLGYVSKVWDEGAVYATGRTKGPPPHYSREDPIGGNFTLATMPTGDWAGELATFGFGTPIFSGYFANDWYAESHAVVRVGVGMGTGTSPATANASMSVKFEEWSRYGICMAIEGGCQGAPGRFTVSGLLSEVDVPGEWWYSSAQQMLYIYPPPASHATHDAAVGDGAAVPLPTLSTPHAGTLVTLGGSSYVTVRDITMTGSTETLATITGGDHNTVGGCTLKNSAGGASISGGEYNTIIGNDIYDVGGHLSSKGDPASNTFQNLKATNNLIANNHITNVYYRGAWGVRVDGQGDRFTHNLVHDAPGQVILPGGPLTMFDNNEVFNTGFVEGDGGVMYLGASLTNGWGMSFRENFVHHSLEVPGLHGRGGIYFDDHQAGISNTSGNVMYKAAGRAFLVNGGAANNITSNLIVNGGEGIYNTNAMATSAVNDLPLYDNGTLKRGDSGDYIWKVEQSLGVPNYKSAFSTPLAERFPTFAKILAVNSTSAGWASPSLSNFRDNIFLNNSGGNICLLTGYHTPAVCDEQLASNKTLSKFVDLRGSHEGSWSSFPGANRLEFVNLTLGFDTGKMGLVCDGWRKAMPPKGGYRPWVKDAFDGIPSAAAGSYTPAAAAARAALRSGQHLILKLNTPCPPVTKTDCSGYWLSWGECEGDGQKVERFTVDQWPLAGGAPCAADDGDVRKAPC